MDGGGFISRGYEGVRDAFVSAQAEDEGGAQLCVYRHGEKVVDLWAGRDKVNDRPYDEDTLTVIMSCTKGAVAAIVHILAERGLIDYEAPVRDYWPEFGAGGKDDARVWQILSHSVGLPGVDPQSGITALDMLSLERHVHALQSMTPVWRPGHRLVGRRELHDGPPVILQHVDREHADGRLVFGHNDHALFHGHFPRLQEH